MKKREIIELKVVDIEFGGLGYGWHDDIKIHFKGGIPGQIVRVMIKKIRKNGIEGKILQTIESSEFETTQVCNHFGVCGGCSMLSLPYHSQLEIKSKQLSNLFTDCGHTEVSTIEVLSSNRHLEYKNKMEFTFGNEKKDDPLSLGMHMINKHNSVTTVNTCLLVDEDYRKIIQSTVEYFESTQLPFYKVLSHQGYLRHLVVRKGHNTNELLINLVTTSQYQVNFDEYVSTLLSLNTQAKIVGILHTINDSFSDAVVCDSLKILYGRDYFYENVLSTTFKISPFSFFQTNTSGAEVLYQTTLHLLKNAQDKVLFDLYSGTGTIGILCSQHVKAVIGVEIVKEAVHAANENIQLNNITNCIYHVGDVKEVVSSLTAKPDIIVLDPPRSGMHPKAIEDVISFDSKEILYISCNPKALVTELNKFKNAGYRLIHAVGIDQFPNTPHVECIVHLVK